MSFGTGSKSSNIRCVEVISNIPNQIERIINAAQDYDEFYYIIHDKDLDSDGNLKKRHIHCIVYDKAGTSINAWVARWDGIVPPQFIEIKNFKANAIKYLTHETAQAKADKKYLYSRDDVVTNVREKYLSYFSEQKPTMPERLQDFQLLKTGKISTNDFVEKYRTEINELNFYQQIRLFGDLEKYGL